MLTEGVGNAVEAAVQKSPFVCGVSESLMLRDPASAPDIDLNLEPLIKKKKKQEMWNFNVSTVFSSYLSDRYCH